ncbi:MAG: hypothetical protein JWO08_3398 [Verrucomicrobiaceae bacterium]|nr:hypothetical protein [Verrucomicrobiaceae bacterium]
MPIIDPATHPDYAAAYQLAGLKVQQEAAAAAQAASLTTNTSAPATSRPTTPLLTFHPPEYFTDFTLPENAILVGDCHLTRGDITVIGGVPGCGKSRLLVSLAIAGAQGPGASWMGHPVHSHFKTAILQAENGEVRLKRELEDIAIQGHQLSGWLHITPPPRCGFAFGQPEFRAQLRDWLAEIKPGIFAIDPWNRAAPDDKVKDFRTALDGIFEVLPDGPDKPAIVIVHHLRKSASSGEGRKRGRDLLGELSGSYIIGSAPRVTFILEPATPDGEDDRVIFTCAKNNNGEMGPSTAWHRRNGLFVPCEAFDWAEWEGGGGETSNRNSLELADMAAIFANGKCEHTRQNAAQALQDSGFSRSRSYKALAPDGKFARHLSEVNGIITFRP